MPKTPVDGISYLSRNELLALLKRVFEVLFGKCYDYEAMAEQIVWLECHGLGGLDLLREGAARLDSETGFAGEKLCMAFAPAGDEFSFNAEGSSLLCFGDLVADMMIANCAATGICRITIDNARHPLAVLPQLSRIAQEGLLAAVRVRHLPGEDARFAHVSVAPSLPALSGWDGVESQSGVASLCIVCASSEEDLRSAMWVIDPQWPEPTITPEHLVKNYSASIDRGVAVADISALTALADRVLVEATEESRCGAGE